MFKKFIHLFPIFANIYLLMEYQIASSKLDAERQQCISTVPSLMEFTFTIRKTDKKQVK